MTHADRHDRGRWLASGLADAMITIMFRDATLAPPHVARWYDSSLTTDEIVEFRRAGRPAPNEAVVASLEALGLPSDAGFVARWEGFDAAMILGAIDRGFTSGEQFAPWAATDADITEAEQLCGVSQRAATALAQLRAGRTPEQIAYAEVAGIKVKKAAVWMDTGMSAATAGAWSTAGFSATSAAAWNEVVDDPVVARALDALGFDVDSAREQRPDGGWNLHTVRWHAASAAGAAPEDADRWAATSLPDRKLAKWVAAGVRPDDADAWLERGFRPQDAAVWSARGFSPLDADAWHRAAIDADVAVRRRDAGVRPPGDT